MLNISEQFVHDYLVGDNELPALTEAISAVNQYISASDTYYASKATRIGDWMNTQPDIDELVLSIFTAALLNPVLSYPAICGLLNYKIQLDEELDRVKTIAEILAVLSNTKLINIQRKKGGENTLVTAGYELDVDIPVDTRHDLNKYPAQQITTNYDDVLGSMLLGGVLNHHEDEICLAHINLMNRIPLSLNVKLMMEHKELATFELDTPEKTAQWNKFREDSIYKYVDVVKQSDNKLYLDHKYDTRGRCYAIGYHINPQGTSYKKAVIQFHKKELVTDEY